MKEIALQDIQGFRIGNAQDELGGTGCTVLIFPDSYFLTARPAASIFAAAGRPAGSRSSSIRRRQRREFMPYC